MDGWLGRQGNVCNKSHFVNSVQRCEFGGFSGFEGHGGFDTLREGLSSQEVVLLLHYLSVEQKRKHAVS